MRLSNVNTAHPDSIFHGYGLSGRAYFEALFFSIGFLLTIALVTLTLSVSLSLAIGGGITPFHVPFAAAVTVTIAYLMGRRERISYSQISITLACVILISLMATAIASFFYDFSYDGQSYHQEAVLQLSGGWNPFYYRLDDSRTVGRWVIHYPKGSWFQAAAIYEFTSSIESSKAPNIILIVISWLFVSSLLINIKNIPAWAALVIATIAALNPVSVYQALNFYVDGQLSSLFISLFVLLVKAMLRPNKYVLVASAALVIMLINLKFTGLVYAVMLIAAFSCAFLYLNGWKQTLKLIAIPVAGVAIGVLFVGFNPYITNILEHGHPFYPVRGEGAIDVVSFTKPQPFLSMNRLEALATSVFSVSSNSIKTYTLKQPFRLMSGDEVHTFYGGYDIRIGGWGPWLGGMLILAIPIAIGVLVACRNRTNKLLMGFLLTVLAVTVLIHPEAWWARYTPQLYIVPLITYTMCLICFSGNFRKFGFLAILLGVLNSAMVSLHSGKGNLKRTIAIHDQLITLQERSAPIIVYFDEFQSNRARLSEAGIAYSTVHNEEELPCKYPETLISYVRKVKFCTEQ